MEEIENMDYEKRKELIRGQTPEDIKQQCYQLCKEYIRGIWANISTDQFVLKRISGGLTNQLYHCLLSDELNPVNNEPKEVAIRIYGKKHFNNLGQKNERHSDSIVALLMAQNKLGPKLYGLFAKGEILEYVECKQFGVKDENDMNLVNEIARKLAKLHSLNVPIKKNNYWIYDNFDHFYRESFEKFPIESMINSYKLMELMSTNLMREIEWIKKAIETTKSPIVFCHNDFRGSNILIKQNESNNERILFCDFEYSSYGFRGIDFGSLFANWGRTNVKHTGIPDEKIIVKFMKEYRNEIIKIEGYDCALDERNTIKNLRMAEIGITSYKNNKRTLIEEKVIDEWL